jgi:hypothetical protein
MAIKKIRSSFIDTGSTSTQVAVGDHTHSDYAASSHTHTGYAASTHTHSEFGLLGIKAIIAINANGTSLRFDGFGFTLDGNTIRLTNQIGDVIVTYYYGSEGKSTCHYFPSLLQFTQNASWIGKNLEVGDKFIIIGH